MSSNAGHVCCETEVLESECCSGEAGYRLPQHIHTQDLSEQQPVADQAQSFSHEQSAASEHHSASDDYPPGRGALQEGGLRYHAPQAVEGGFAAYLNTGDSGQQHTGGPGYNDDRQESGYNDAQGSGYNTHPNHGDSGYDAREGSGYNTHQNTLGSAYDQTYAGRADRDAPGASEWTGSILVNRSEGAPATHETSTQHFVPHPSIGSGFTGTYSIRHCTEHSHDSGTWFQPPMWQSAPQDQSVSHMHQQAQPQYSRYDQQQLQDQQVAPQHAYYQGTPSQYQPFLHEHQPQDQRAEPQYGQTPEQYQQEAPQRDHFEHAPSQHQPGYDDYQHAQLQDQQQEGPQYSRYQHEPAPYHHHQQQQQQPQQAGYGGYRLQAQQSEPEYSQFQEEQARQQLPASPPYRQERQPEPFPGQQEVDAQLGQHAYEPTQRQNLLMQRARYDQADSLSQQAQPQHAGIYSAPQQQGSQQYGEQHQGAPQDQDVLPQQRQYDGAPSESHRAELQHGHQDESALQHQRDVPHTSQHEHSSQQHWSVPPQQGGASLRGDVEPYERAMPQAAATHGQDGQAAAWNQAALGHAPRYEQRSQHEQIPPEFEPDVLSEAPQTQLQHDYRQSGPERTVPPPQHEHPQEEEPRRQSDHREHFQMGPFQPQQAEGVGRAEPSLQYQQAGQQLAKQQVAVGVQSLQGERLPDQPAPSFQPHQPGPELSQPQQALSQSAAQEDGFGLATSQAEMHMLGPSQPAHLAATEPQHQPEHGSEESSAGPDVPSANTSGELTGVVLTLF